MKKRLQKKKMKNEEARRRALLHEALDLVLDINGVTECRKKEISGKPTAFFNFSGHTLGVDVRICPHGWESDSVPKTFSGYLDYPGYTGAEHAMRTLKTYLGGGMEG